MLRERVKRVHFVGVGGIGMSGIAKILLEMGYEVSGSDIKDNSMTQELKRLGAEVYIGHKRENLKERVDVVVYSSAVREDNPELLKARELRIPVIPRGEMLAELFRLKEGIAVSGSHGKTTTTSMIASILETAGFDPTVIVGGKLKRLGGNAKLGTGDLLVSEADESDGSFLKLDPVVSVVTNIDREHLDFYEDIEAIRSAFSRFVEAVPFYGFAVVNWDDPEVRKAVEASRRRVITCSLDTKDSDIRGELLGLKEGRYEFHVFKDGEKLGRIHLGISGRHNVYNALFASSAALELGIEFGLIKRALEEFRNAERRMEFKGWLNGAPVFDDYGHHPTEIRCVISALREMYPDRELILVFQPHRYSRTYYLFEDFVEVLRLPDKTFLLDIFPASEVNLYKVSAEDLARQGGAIYVEDEKELMDTLREEASPDKAILFMGAGDISLMCDCIMKALGSLPEDLKKDTTRK